MSRDRNILGIHTLKEGSSILLMSMTDAHVINTVKLVLRKVLAATEVRTELPVSTQRLYGITPISEDEKVAQIHRAMTFLNPYFALMVRKGLSDASISEMLAKLVPDVGGQNIPVTQRVEVDRFDYPDSEMEF